MPRLRPHLLTALAAVLVLIQLFVLYWPVVTVEGPVSWTDKVVHLLVFAVPTFAVGLAARRVWVPALVFAVHAPASELVQHFVLPGRSGDVWDAVVDLVAVGLAVLALLVARGRREHW
jgi:VanZ family protein